MYDVSTGAAYAVLYSILAVFTIIAILSAGYCGKGRMLRRLGCILLPKASVGEEEGAEGGDIASADFFLAARNSASAK
jgi:hypothetical protein